MLTNSKKFAKLYFDMIYTKSYAGQHSTDVTDADAKWVVETATNL